MTISIERKSKSRIILFYNNSKWNLTFKNYESLFYICVSNMWTVNFHMFKMDLEKAKQPEIKLPTSAGSLKKQESSRKTSISALFTMTKPLTVWITINCEKFWKRWEYQTTWPASWEIWMQVMKQQLELNMGHWAPWGRKELDTTEQLNWAELNW